MIPKKLLKHLETSKTKHEIIQHRTVYTAYDAAATMRVKLNQIAKSLLVKFNKPFEDGSKPYAIAIAPADKNLDLKKLAKVVSDRAVKLNKELRAKKPAKSGPAPRQGGKQLIDIYNKVSKVNIPKERIMKDKFKVKPGAMSAFGSLYKIPVFLDKALKDAGIFAASSFNESIKMAVNDFIKLENALTGNFSVAKKIKKSKISKPKSKAQSKKSNTKKRRGCGKKK